MENLQTVQEVFSDKLLRVPNYQRGYSWEEKQWQDLIADLEDLPDKKEHYTGTIILHLDEKEKAITEEAGKQLRIYNIVDGQQRLTTILILLNCISRQLKENRIREVLARGIREDYIQIIDFEGQKRCRLRLNRDCHEFFEKNIISEFPTLQGPIIKSHQRLEDAKIFFSNFLADKRKTASDQYESFLLNLHKKITNYLRFTVYQVPDASDVGVIFEVMNNRGKPLSEMEKVKNYLLYLSSKIPLDAADNLDDRINNIWGELFENLMESDASSMDHENQLLRSSWLMAYNYFPRDWDGYATIKREFSLKKYASDYSLLLDIIEKYTDILNQSCQAYCDILSPNREQSFNKFMAKKDVRDQLRGGSERLVRIGNIAPFLPILMAIRIKYPEDYEFYLKALDICEKYAFRIYRFHERRSNTGQTFLFKQGNLLFKGEIAPEVLLASLKKRLLDYSPDERYSEKMQLGKMNWYNFYGLKYFLYEYEEYLSQGKGVQLPWGDVLKKDRKDTIEHILPQDPSREYWKQMWPADKIQIYLNDIGNLTLTFDNSVYGNKPYPEKRGEPGKPNCYMTSNLFQEKELARYVEWTEKEVLERRKKIINWATERWKVELESNERDILEDYEIDEELEPTKGQIEEEDDEDSNETPGLPLCHQGWTELGIKEYFEDLKESGKEWTLFYFKVLANTEGKIYFFDLIKKIGEMSGKPFTGKQIAGVLSGVYKKTAKKGLERLDLLDKSGWYYVLNPKYKEIIKKYFGFNE
jgi:uncharacterized protein with ParB-like and HNH nuclease domain